MNNMEYSKLAILDILKEFLKIYNTKLNRYWSGLSNKERELSWNVDTKENLEINICQLKDIISLYEDKVELLVNNFNKVVFKARVYVMTIEKIDYYYKVTLSMEYNGEVISNMFAINFYDSSMNYNFFESSSSSYIRELYNAIEIDKQENLVHEQK